MWKECGTHKKTELSPSAARLAAADAPSAKKIAEKLGIPCYDAEIIQEMAKETGFAPDYVNDQWIGHI